MRKRADSPTGTPAKAVSILCVAVFVILGSALFRLQIVQGDHYWRLSERNYIVQVQLKAPRGDITDGHGRLVAGSRQSFSVCAVPRSFLQNKQEISILGRILDLDSAFIVSRLKQSSRSYRPTAILRDVDFATVSRVEELFADLPDVLVVSEPVRCYPSGIGFSHIIGYVGEVTQDEIEASRGRYGPGDFVGKAGVEKMYEAYLAGEDGEKFVKITVGGGASRVDLEDLPADAPNQGMKVVLSADYGLQTLAYRLLDGRRGSIIVLDVRSGGVLALASCPAFDPDLFATGISIADWDNIITSEGKPLLNRAIQSSYPPGSTYKIVTAGAGLESGVITAHSRFRPCRGSYRFGNRNFACWKPEGHGSADLTRAVSVSCDVYFYQLGENLGLDRFAAYGQKWHLNEPTGIDLPGEVGGLIPEAAYYDSVYGRGKWTKGIMLNLAIGQGEILLTPMEMICFVCGVANKGWYSAPRCVMRIESEDKVFVPTSRKVNLEISSATVEILRRSMLEVVEGAEGTAKVVRLPRPQVAGKTGTAQNPHGDDHAWFICFAPYEDPEIAICVMLENAGHGAAVAAPLAREILLHYFQIPDQAEQTEEEEVASLR